MPPSTHQPPHPPLYFLLLLLLLIPSAFAHADAPVRPGQFTSALDVARSAAATTTADDAYALPPITVEAWVQLRRTDRPNVIVSSEDRRSTTHWQLHTEAETGRLAATVPGYEPAEIVADAAVTPGQWHHVAMTFSPDRLRLYLDGERVADQPIAVRDDQQTDRIPGRLKLAHARRDGERFDCNGLIEQLRIRRGIRTVAVPDALMGIDGHTLGLWRFDRIRPDGTVSDLGARGRRLRLDSAPEFELLPDIGDGAFRESSYHDSRWDHMDTGPFFSASIRAPVGVTTKALAVRIGDEGEAAMCFDTEMLRMSKAWTGGFIQTRPRRFGIIELPEPAGDIAWHTPDAPGWADADGAFDDPREPSFGPLPESHGRYNGLHLHGDRVVLDYTIHDFDILESPWLIQRHDLDVFTRNMRIGPGRAGEMQIAHDGEAEASRTVRTVEGRDIPLALLKTDDTVTAAAIVHADADADAPVARFTVSGRRIRLALDERDAAARLELLIWTGDEADLDTFAAIVADAAAEGPAPLELLTEPGPGRWGEPIATEGTVSQRDEPYVIDTLTVPYDNPWNALMFIGGHDFLPNGDAAVATAHGDVWIVSGIDDTLENLQWKRFATGLFQPLGLKVHDGRIYVTGRDQITILHDLSGNGEADYYENFNNHGHVTHNGHEYVTNLEVDSEGWFYFTKANTNGATDHDGTLLRISPDGSELEVFATGFRNTNGMGLGPDDQVTVAPQEGTWTPASMIALAQPGGFYGFMPSHHRAEKPDTFDPPLCFIPRRLDNSSGSQVWAPDEGFGPLSGQMLHLSYGRASWMLVLTQQINDELWQGGVVELPGRFLSGAHRGRFNPHDGHLYVSGIQGWQTAAVRDGSLQRVRYTGGDLHVPTDMHIGGTCVRLTFAQPLRRDFAENLESYAVEQWNYRWSENYGSDDYSVASPDRRGRDPVALASATLSEDGRSLCLQIPSLQPVMQMGIRYNLEAADGSLVRGAVYPTINAVPDHCPCED